MWKQSINQWHIDFHGKYYMHIPHVGAHVHSIIDLDSRSKYQYKLHSIRAGIYTIWCAIFAPSVTIQDARLLIAFQICDCVLVKLANTILSYMLKCVWKLY